MQSDVPGRRKFPLQIHISLLVIGLILAISLTLSWLSYRHVSELIMLATEQLFANVPVEAKKGFDLKYRPVNAAVAVLSTTSIATAGDLDSRMAHIAVLAEVIDHEPQVAGFQLGYEDGDYFILRPLRTSQSRDVFLAPDAANYVVDHIERSATGKTQHRLFLDPVYQVIARADLGSVDYDPRLRPWYIAAKADGEANQVTAPYRFFFLQQYGVTLSRLAHDGGSVLAVDVTLDSLSTTLADNRISETAVSLIANSNGEILAHSGLDITPASDEVLTLEGMAHPLVGQFLGQVANMGDIRRVRYLGEDWLGVTQHLDMVGGERLTLLVAAPEKELFASAFALRLKGVLLTIGVIILALPLAWFAANKIARPLHSLAMKAKAIARLDFTGEASTPSAIEEVGYLVDSMELMKSTISNFLALINSLSGEPDIDRLLKKVTEETMNASRADCAVAYLVAEDESSLQPFTASFRNEADAELLELTAFSLDESTRSHPLVEHFHSGEVGLLQIDRVDPSYQGLASLYESSDCEVLNLIILPLRDRQQESRGLLVIVFKQDAELSPERIGFSRALSGFAAVTMESGQLLRMQKRLLQSFIELIASAIDAKSPYTGGHCQRVPELTQMLAQAACDSREGLFADFGLDEDQWEALHIASWLHDCGKVTTPEYVVDKSTKLETLCDRIHEVRMRFEVLKRDAEIQYWQQRTAGGDEDSLELQLQQMHQQLDEEFAFVAACNEGGEFLADEHIARLRKIGERSWKRTLDDRIGISWEEKQRKERSPAAPLPVDEALLADKIEHRVYRRAKDIIADDNPWGFHLQTPEYKYNRGELYNLSVRRGTLAEEERFAINDHMVQTIIMLDQLPFPRHLREVPEIAGGHHEKMNGTGYPRRLTQQDMSLTARMMAIADIFEALTAADRPYKKAKSIGASIGIMKSMAAEQHIDRDLFNLFLRSGVYRDYAEKFLAPEQIDDVDIQQYLLA